MLSKFKTLIKYFSPAERRYFFLFTSLILISGVVLSVIVFNKSTHQVPVRGGVWQEGVVGQPVFVNPVLSGNNDVDRDLISLTFCSLYDIAEKIELADNQLDWQIRLRDNITWHDGAKLTSDDIIFTIQKIQDPEFKSPLSSTWQGIIATRVSEREISLTLGAPFAFFEDNLKKLYPIPKHIYADIPISNWRLSDYNLKPLGCGPFQFDSYKKKNDGFITKYTLINNENYFAGAPFLDKIEFNFYTEPAKAIEDFLFAKLNGLGNLTQNEVNLIKRNHDLKVLPTPRYFSAFLNQNAHPALKDKNVRLALGTAINRDQLIKETLGGYATPINGPVTPNFLNDSSLYLPENIVDHLAKASSILENSGWSINEATGLRKKTARETVVLEFDLVVPETPLLVNTAEFIQKSWNSIGVKTNLIILSPETINNEVINDRDYQILLFGNIIGANPDLFSFWHSSQKFSPGLNLSLYDKPTADKLIESIRQEFDTEYRMSDLISLQTLISGDIPAIFLHSPNYLYLVSPNLGGFKDKLIITPSNRFDDVSSWYLKTARRLK